MNSSVLNLLGLIFLKLDFDHVTLLFNGCLVPSPKISTLPESVQTPLCFFSFIPSETSGLPSTNIAKQRLSTWARHCHHHTAPNAAPFPSHPSHHIPWALTVCPHCCMYAWMRHMHEWDKIIRDYHSLTEWVVPAEILPFFMAQSSVDSLESPPYPKANVS